MNSLFELGTLLLFAISGLSLWAMVAGTAGVLGNKSRLQVSAVRAVLGIFPLVVSASGILVYGFVNDHFEIKYIAYNSERSMPIFYKLSAFWGSLEGSLLLWLVILSGFAFAAMLVHRRRDSDLIALVAAVLALVMGFFSTLMLVTTNPFTALDFLPSDGLGLNPLLQNPGMVVHPPMMYFGFVGLTIPFAFAVAALVTGALDARWVRTTRVWTIIAWITLTLGNLLGANWAYVELGWGGYWGWDPVENSALMPWFTVTAFLHSVMIQEKRGMLKVWNVVLILLSFWLTIFGTFLTRSGVVSSVHAFSDSNLGIIFLAFLGLMMLGSTLLLLWRWDALKPDNPLESPVSREGAFLLNNLLLLTIALIVLWGTTWPIIAEAISGKRASVGAPLFNEMNSIPALMLLLLMGIGPVLAWRRTSGAMLRRTLTYPSVGMIAAAVVEAMIGSTHYFAIGAAGFCTFSLIVIVAEYARGIRVRMGKGENPFTAIGRLFVRNPRRYAGYIVHVGVVMACIAFAGNLFATEKNAIVAVGETVVFEGYPITLREIREIRRSNFDSTMAIFDVGMSNGDTLQMWPEKRSYRGAKAEQSTEVSIHSTLLSDLYLIVLDRLDATRVTMRVHKNPGVQLLWLGGVIMALGALLGILLSRRATSKG